MTDHNQYPPCPAEIRDLWCARVSFNGGPLGHLSTDICQLSDLIRSDLKVIEEQFERTPLADWDAAIQPHVYGLIGIFRTSQEASAAVRIFQERRDSGMW